VARRLGVLAGRLAAIALTAGCLSSPPDATSPPGDGGPPPEPIRRLARPHNSHCAIRGGGALFCWGAGDGGQLGDGAGDDRAEPVAVLDGSDEPLTGIVAVATGRNHSCAVTSDREVTCWGSNGTGQLGDGGTATTLRAETRVVGAERIAMLSTFGPHTCAADLDGGVWCWGRNDNGELGNGGLAEESLTAGRMLDTDGSIEDAIDVGAGEYHTCLVRSDQRVWCAGLNDAGQLGRFAGEDCECSRKLPRAVEVIEGTYLELASQVAGGVGLSCALVGDAVFCWGDPRCGQLGDGSDTGCAERSAVVCDDEGASPPVAVELDAVAPCEAIQIGAGEDYACALCAEGQVACWGQGAFGQLGDGQGMSSATPVRVAGIEDAVEIAVGFRTACALRAGGEVLCWGDGQEGQLGNGDIGAALISPAPVSVVGLPP
jgi:alpha-tubulin suppressor-like RCC1 family protein